MNQQAKEINIQKPREAKQVLVWRNDLKVRKGKLASQIAHASIAFLTNKIRLQENENETSKPLLLSEAEQAWIDGRFIKVCVRVDSEEELLAVYQKALDVGLTSYLIEDAGLTEFHGVKTKTCIGIGPHWPEELDPITGHLKLL